MLESHLSSPRFRLSRITEPLARHFQSLLCVVIIGLLITSRTQFAQKPSFEVTSIKPYVQPAPGLPHLYGFRVQPGGRFIGEGVTLKMLIAYAYRVQEFQVIGGPDWVSSDRWEILGNA